MRNAEWIIEILNPADRPKWGQARGVYQAWGVFSALQTRATSGNNKLTMLSVINPCRGTEWVQWRQRGEWIHCELDTLGERIASPVYSLAATVGGDIEHLGRRNKILGGTRQEDQMSLFRDSIKSY